LRELGEVWCAGCASQQKKRLRKAGDADEIDTVQAEARQAQAKAKSQAELKKSLFGDDDDDDDGAPLAAALRHVTPPHPQVAYCSVHAPVA
jgi:hypothetical protein